MGSRQYKISILVRSCSLLVILAGLAVKNVSPGTQLLDVSCMSCIHISKTRSRNWVCSVMSDYYSHGQIAVILINMCKPLRNPGQDQRLRHTSNSDSRLGRP